MTEPPSRVRIVLKASLKEYKENSCDHVLAFGGKIKIILFRSGHMMDGYM